MRNPIPSLALAIFLAGGLAACCQDRSAPVATAVAERVFLNGAIYTADADRRTASAMAVAGDRILFVGDDDSADSWIGDDTIVINLQGRRVLPGLHDAHVHPVETIRIDRCDLENAALDLAQLATFVAACLERLAVPPGKWLIVKNWNFSEGNKPADGLQTPRAALDRASLKHPLLLENSDSHHFATNSAGLARARTRSGEQLGLSAATLAGPFSDIAHFVDVDNRGEPSGEVHETVYQRLGVSRAVLIHLEALLPEAGQMPAWFNSRGITSLLEAAFYPELAPVYDSLAAQDKLSLRITLAQHYEPDDFKDAGGKVDIDAIMARARVTRDRYAALGNIKADHLKYYVDGVLEGNPLSNPPGLPNGALLKYFHQPLFTLDPTTRELILSGYVDPHSEVCKSVRATGITGLTRTEVDAFVERDGFYPAQCARSRGVTFQSTDTTLAFTRAAVANEFSVHFHAIGDRAVQVATDAIAAVTTGKPATNRHSIAHAQLVSPEDGVRIAALKIPVAFTFSWASRDFDYDATVIPFVDRLGSLQDMYDPANYYMQQAYPARWILDAGGVLAAGSDAPVGSADPLPFLNIEIAVTRDDGDGPLNADERIGILDAIDAYTINGARMMQQDDITGSLEAGKKADFIILDRDIIALANQGRADEISDTLVLETWFNGRPVYRQGEKMGSDWKKWGQIE